MKKAFHAALGLMLVVLLLSGCSKINNDLDGYLNSGNPIDEYAAKVLPSLDGLPEYEDIRYQYLYLQFFFTSETMMLTVTYDQETYDTEKAKLEERYQFLDHAVIAWFDQDAYTISEYEFTIDQYHFRVVDDPQVDDQEEYPKSFGMIATSDEKRSIAYFYIYDEDLDLIGNEQSKEEMVEFLKEYFWYPQ